MTEQAQTPPADAAPPAGTTPPAADAPAALVKPDFLPADYWDDKAGIKTDEFAKHYGELTAAQQKAAERAATIPDKPEGYKVELKLPEGVKLPDGVAFDPSKDPRLPELLKVAHANGITNETVNQLVALDAQFALQSHAAEQTRVAAEIKKLGEKATDRIAAVTNWTKALSETGGLSADETAEIRSMASSAAGVSALEKLMAKATGAIPGHVPTPPGTPQPKPIADRIWPNGFSSTPQAKVG